MHVAPMTTTIKAEPVEIAIGTSRYKVGIDGSTRWQSGDGLIVREYLKIGKPGIREVAKAFLIITPDADETAAKAGVKTDHGLVVWLDAAGSISHAKRAAINAWFVAVLKK